MTPTPSVAAASASESDASDAESDAMHDDARSVASWSELGSGSGSGSDWERASVVPPSSLSGRSTPDSAASAASWSEVEEPDAEMSWGLAY